MADVSAYRLRPSRCELWRLSTLTVSTFYMIAQMVGAGTLVACCSRIGITYQRSGRHGGLLMVAYVVFGGMLATTWVQIIKAILLMGGTILLSTLVLAHFDFSFAEVLRRHLAGRGRRQDSRTSCNRACATNRLWRLDLISLGLALIFGTAGCRTSWCVSTPCPTPRRPRERGLGDGHHRQLLHHDHVPRFRRGHDCGKGFHRGNGGINMSAPLLAQNWPATFSSRSFRRSPLRRSWRSWPD
jgi:cation/acetate symporter